MDKQTKIGLIAIIAFTLVTVGYSQIDNLKHDWCRSQEITHFDYSVQPHVGVKKDGDGGCESVITYARDVGMDGYVIDSAGEHVVLFDPNRTTAMDDFQSKHPGYKIELHAGSHYFVSELSLILMSQYNNPYYNLYYANGK